MKILYVVTGLGLGGAEKVVVELADQMKFIGHHVKIVYLKGKMEVCPKNKDIEVIFLSLENIFNSIGAYKKYKKIIKNFQPDVVHAHMIHANIFARISRKFCPVPKLICTAHNSNEGGKLRMLAYKFTNNLSDINTNVSSEASQSLINKGAFKENNITTVYNGIDLEKFNISTLRKNGIDEEIRFLSVGRFSQQKDYPNLLNAIALLRNKLPFKVKFYIAGDGELRDVIESLIDKLEVGNLVELLGKRSDIPDLLSAADFFVLPSKHEGLPTVVIEAMACHTFVIATDCGGSAEIMEDTGILVPIQDSIALSQAILDALSIDNKMIVSNNIKARKRVEELFSLKASVGNWLKIYESK